MCSSRDMLADTQTHTYRQTDTIRLTIALAIVRMSSICSLCLKCPCLWISDHRLQLLINNTDAKCFFCYHNANIINHVYLNASKYISNQCSYCSLSAKLTIIWWNQACSSLLMFQSHDICHIHVTPNCHVWVCLPQTLPNDFLATFHTLQTCNAERLLQYKKCLWFMKAYSKTA